MEPVSAERGPYAKSAEVRRRIIEACIQAFTTAGYHGATMADVARRAQISHTGLLHHFPTKAELLIAVLDYGDEERAEYLRAHDALDPATAPMAVLRELTRSLLEDEVASGLIELNVVMSGEATALDHPAHDYLADRYARIRRFYLRLYVALRDAGQLRQDLDPETAATMTIALMQGLQAQWFYDPEGVDGHAIVAAFLRSVIAEPGE